MEFLLFLNSHEREILELITKANYGVEENTPLCLLGEKFMGFFKRKQKRIVICTENAKTYGDFYLNKLKNRGEAYKTSAFIRKALRHESVHVAQHCNNGKLLDLSRIGNYKLNPSKMQALKASSIFSGEIQKEYEAYILEDKPRLVVNVLKKYCM